VHPLVDLGASFKEKSVVDSKLCAETVKFHFDERLEIVVDIGLEETVLVF